MNKKTFLILNTILTGLLYFLHFNFLITSNLIIISILILAISLVLCFYILKKKVFIIKLDFLGFISNVYLIAVILGCSMYISQFFFLKEATIHKSSINGYSLRRIDSVFFSFEEKTFKRFYSLDEFSAKEHLLLKNGYVSLELNKGYAHCYYIKKMIVIINQ